MPASLSRAFAALALLAAAPPPDARQTLRALQRMDVALATTGYRLATANVALCQDRQPASGLLIHGIEQYGPAYRTAAADLFSLGSAPGIAAILPGSPAERAGIRPGDELRAINGAPLPPEPRGHDFTRIAAVLDRLDAALAAGPVTLGLARGPVTLAGIPACASRFQVTPSDKLAAGADGRIVEIDSGLMAYANDGNEIAVIVAHELAHNILGHPARLDRDGVSRRAKIGKDAGKIRETEIEADLFSLRLLANAGYPLEAAPAFWRRFGKQHGFGIFSDSTHLRWKKRVALIEAEIARLKVAK